MPQSVVSHSGRAPWRLLVVLLMLLSAVAIGGPALESAGATPGPVSINMISAPNPVASNAQLTHTITIANTGGAAVSDVAVTDQVPGMTGLILQSTAGT